MANKVFIGVGHGGSDPGAVKFITEKEYTLKTAKAVSEYLKGYGIENMLSRTADIDTDMDSKVAMCNKYNPDLIADIHFNAGGGTGFEVYCSIAGGVSKKLAENIAAETSKIMKNRGVRTKTGDGGSDYFAIIRETKAPAVLLEGGFVDTQSDADFIKKDYKKLAKAYADGIARTLGVTVGAADKVLDSDGYRKGEGTIGLLALKELLLIAGSLGINKYKVDKNRYFGDGTLKAVNSLLGSWGYMENGIAGEGFIKRLHSEIEKKMK